MKIIYFIALLLVPVQLAVAATNDITSLVQKGLFEEEANHNLEVAMQHYQTAIGSFDQDRKLIATAIFRMGECYRKQGKTNEATVQYQRILQEFSDQTELAKLSAEYAGGIKSTVQNKFDKKQDDLHAQWELLKHQETTARRLSDRVAKFSPNEKVNYFTTIERDNMVEKLTADLAGIEDAFIQVTNNYGPKSPEYQTAKATLNGIKSQIEKRVQALVWGLDQNAAALTDQRAAVEDRLQKEMSAEGKNPFANHFNPAPTNAVMISEEQQEIQKIKAMIQNSPDLINARDASGTEKGLAPLHKAAKSGQLAMAEFLLANGADIESITQNGEEKTPLILAAQEGRKTLVELLIGKGAKVNAREKDGSTALHYAVMQDFKTVAETLLTYGADVNVKASKNGWTPLHTTAYLGSLASAEVLLAHGADVNARNDDNGTPLISVVMFNGKTTLVKLLLDRGADVNAKDNEGNTALYWAVEEKNSETIELLIDHKAFIEATNAKGFTPLLTAVSADSPDYHIIKTLLNHGADIKARGVFQETLLFIAVAAQKNDIVQLLIDHKADVNITNSYGFTPLLAAVNNRTNDINIVKTLLLNRADPDVQLTNSRLGPSIIGLRAINYVIRSDRFDLVQLLLAHHANPNVRLVEHDHFGSEGREGVTPLMMGILGGMRYSEDIVEFLLDHGADPNLADAAGWTPLHHAVMKNNKRLVEILIAHHGDVNRVNLDGKPPIAYVQSSPAITEMLRQAGADKK